MTDCRGLNLAVSPYHLTTGEPAAMAALLIADRVTTFMPAPQDMPRGGGEAGRARVAEAVEQSPRFLRLMEAWRWTMPLWRAGVIGSGREGDEVAGDLRTVWEQVIANQSLTTLRPLLRSELYTRAEEHLDLVCGDMLKGGVDPGIGLLVSAGMDQFSLRHGLRGVRAGFEPGGGSVSQRAEAAMGTRVFGIAIPILLRAGGERILRAREALAGELDELRAAMVDAAANAAGAAHRLARAAAAYAAAFQRLCPELLAGDDEQGWRVQEGWVSITGVTVPGDAVIRSCLTAAKTLSRRTGASLPNGSAYASPQGMPDLLTLVVRRMNVRPEASGSVPFQAAPPTGESGWSSAHRRGA